MTDSAIKTIEPQCSVSFWVSTDSLSADGYNAIFAHDVAASIGAWDHSGTGTFSRHHDGRIDELRIYDQLLTPSQIELIGLREILFQDGMEEQ